MTLQALMETVITSKREDWHTITCFGADRGPAYRDRFSFWSEWNGQSGVLQAESHDIVAVYMPDVSITLSWGLHHIEDFEEDWANKFSEPRSSSAYVDVFYNNALVFRDISVAVDGGGANLPLPIERFDDANERVIALEVPRRRHDFIRLVGSLEGPVDVFDRYFREAGFMIVDDDWPKFGRDQTTCCDGVTNGEVGSIVRFQGFTPR